VGLPQRSLQHSSQRLDVSRLPALKPARGPPARPAGKQAARSQLPADDGFFADPDSSTFKLCREDETDRCYSEFDCMDESPVVKEKTRDESKEARQPRSLLDLLEHFPGLRGP